MVKFTINIPEKKYLLVKELLIELGVTIREEKMDTKRTKRKFCRLAFAAMKV